MASRASASETGGGAGRWRGRRRGRPAARPGVGLDAGVDARRGRARRGRWREPVPKSSPPAVPTTRWETPVKASSAGSIQLWANQTGSRRARRAGRVVVGDVAVRLEVGEDVPPAVAVGAGGQAAGDPAEEVPDVDRLLDHPVAGALPPRQPVAVAADRPVAADPGRPALDERPELAAVDQVHPVAIPRVRPPLEPDVDRPSGDRAASAMTRSHSARVGASGFSA